MSYGTIPRIPRLIQGRPQEARPARAIHGPQFSHRRSNDCCLQSILMSFYNRPRKEDRLPPSNHVRFLVACFAAVFCIAAPVFAQSTPKAEDRISFTFTAG